MTSSIWLIAEREFRTYVATFSFWAALAIGPLAAGGGLLLVEGTHPTQAAPVVVVSRDPNLAHAVQVALEGAASLEGRHLAFAPSGVAVTAAASAPAQIDLIFESGFPLSGSGRALVARTLERDAARRAAGAIPLEVHQRLSFVASAGRGPASIARFLLMAMLWLTLTGSLGMLLQTVVRERATRALESLLASAAPWQIMLGKLIGVGGVSLLILGAWLGSSAALALFVPQAGLAPSVLMELVRPGLLLGAALLYCLAYAFYGSVTVALGAMARDSASAQNLSRPMFILLVMAFFVAMAAAMGNVSSLSWLLYIPVFTPFLLLIVPMHTVPIPVQLLLFGMLALSSLLVARFAAGRLALTDSGAGLPGRAR